MNPLSKALLFLAMAASFGHGEERRAGSDWWSLQPIQRPACPNVKEATWTRSPLDSFILSALRDNRLKPSKRASRRALARRLSFDLLGLPPMNEDSLAFECEPSPNAYERLLDRHLASPHYGERWARHWLDIARFGESQGFERDKLRPNSWRYRDWVVEALNADMPYDEFVSLQIAGDVLLPGSDEGIIATGFLVAGAYDEVGQSQQSAAMRAIVRQEELEDYVSTVGQAFLGLTVHCARCHDHKFDPISQKEYFQLASALSGVSHGEREISKIPSAGFKRSLESQLASLERAPAQHEPEINHLKSQIERWHAKQVYAVAPKKPGIVHVLNRGNPNEPREVVAPAGVRALQGPNADFGLNEDAPDSERRIRLASWITAQNNPLFARVIANRLWHYHFGRGLVANPSDFGLQGGMPSHPELLDWLAAEIAERGWSLKALHRLILTSASYRQSSTLKSEALRQDSDNRLLWRKSPTRLEAEALRDAILQVSGQWNRSMRGPGYYDFTTYVHNTQFYTMIDPVGPSFNRRSLYRTWVRSARSPFLDAFDCPDPSVTAPKRAQTTTPLQSLSLMNSAFVLRMADHFADRVQAQAGNATRPQVKRAFALVYGREPDANELADSARLVERHGLAALCRVLFNSNEFLYVY